MREGRREGKGQRKEGLQTHTGIVVVHIDHPEGDRQQLEDVEGMKYLLHQQDMVWLHRNIDRVKPIARQPVEHSDRGQRSHLRQRGS